MDYLWKNPIEAAEMGRCAEARYWKLFTGSQMAEAYVELYDKLLVEHNVPKVSYSLPHISD